MAGADVYSLIETGGMEVTLRLLRRFAPQSLRVPFGKLRTIRRRRRRHELVEWVRRYNGEQARASYLVEPSASNHPADAVEKDFD